MTARLLMLAGGRCHMTQPAKEFGSRRTPSQRERTPRRLHSARLIGRSIVQSWQTPPGGMARTARRESWEGGAPFGGSSPAATSKRVGG